MNNMDSIDTCLPVNGSSSLSSDKKQLKHKRRYCRTPGCTNIVKSQGLCQRHGAKPRMCKVVGCQKQAQGNFDGMCKSHFKAHKRNTTPLPPRPQEEVVTMPPPPQGESVYDGIIPASIAWNPNMGTPMPLIAHLRAGFEDPTKPPPGTEMKNAVHADCGRCTILPLSWRAGNGNLSGSRSSFLQGIRNLRSATLLGAGAVIKGFTWSSLSTFASDTGTWNARSATRLPTPTTVTPRPVLWT